jgi:PKD repeat protein
MKRYRTILAVPLILVITLIFIAGSLQISPAPIFAYNGNPHLLKTFIGPDGQEVDKLIFPVKPPAIKEKPVKVAQPNIQMGINSVSSSVPAFYWSYGCSATSAAMLFGYYDLKGYSNMYSGPTNSGNCPLDNSVWGTTTYPSVTCGECPLSATHAGKDGREIGGHVDDYWVDYGNTSDPYIINGLNEHTPLDCAGDFMGTNQSKYGNTDGSTIFYFYTNGAAYGLATAGDGAYGMKLFAQSKGYTVTAAFNQYIKGYANPWLGFTFANYISEIDAGRPVLIQVSGHTMLGYGYNTTGNVIYLHDTWDYSDHTMTWGGSYAGMQHYGVTVIRLATPVTPVAPVAAFTASPTSGSAPMTVQFTDQSTNNPTSWSWVFGDGGTSNVKNPSHTYSAIGKFTVSLTATNIPGSNTKTITDYITVSAAPVPTINVISPNGGEVWDKGSSKTIYWSSTNLTGNVKIELSRDGGTTWTPIAASTANDGSQTWRVTRPATTLARIKISSVTNSPIFDISNNNFTIR